MRTDTKSKARGQRNGFLNMRLPAPIWKQLRKQADAEDRTMAYLARVFIKAGLDDRAKGA